MLRHVRILAGSLKPNAGSHIYNRQLIRRLVERGHRVSVVSFDDGGEDWGDVELTRLPRYDWDGVPTAWRFATTLQSLRSRCEIAAAHLSRPDIVIATEHLFLKGHAQRFPQTPWLYLPHSLVIAHEIDSYGMTGLQHRLTRHFYMKQQLWALRHASGTVRFNQSASDALQKFYGADAIQSPILINPPGIDVPVNAVRNREAEPDRPLRLLFVGRLVVSKNLDLVLRTLDRHQGGNWTLDVIGDGPERDLSQKLVDDLGLRSHVTLHGYQSEPGDWYAKADLLLFPSKLENMPLVLMESMSQGTPALVIREDGERYRVPFSEVVNDQVTGLLADDENDFAQRLANVITRPECLRGLSQSAQTYVQTNFTWERHLNCYEEHFDRLLSSSSESAAIASDVARIHDR
ncbi:MAG: glycosyltransferase family 4 protein [Planctomycetota bacterium]|nr:glycosyltransferase family 4 protein [Planctomycetota bacterium]MDA1162348.1 glycosyltransferase family 4 protein [Planctomycetota bacterium]